MSSNTIRLTHKHVSLGIKERTDENLLELGVISQGQEQDGLRLNQLIRSCLFMLTFVPCNKRSLVTVQKYS